MSLADHQVGIENPRYRHGGRMGGRSAEYVVWQSMRARCRNARHVQYADYGGRGVTVCARWDRFENFLADMGARPEGLTLERKNNSGNYEPNNCCWATRLEQRLNSRHIRWVAVGDERLPLKYAAQRQGISSATLRRRLEKESK